MKKGKFYQYLSHHINSIVTFHFFFYLYFRYSGFEEAE